MPEKVNIASLTIEVDDVVKESVRLKKEIDGLRESQKELRKSGEQSSQAFVDNERKIKSLSKTYRDNQKFASALEKTNEDLTKTMQVQGKSTQQLMDDRAALNQIAKQIQGNTQEEIDLRNQLNTAINEQSEAIKDQSSKYIKNKENIGNYTESINLADFNLRSFIDSSEDAGGASKTLKGGLIQAGKGMATLTRATLAFIATPIGIVLGAIAGAFVLVKNAMNRSEDATASVRRAFSGLSGIVKGLQRILEPLGKFLIDGIVKGFELIEKGAFKAFEIVEKGLRFLGLEKAADGLGSFASEIENAAEQSKELTQAELNLARAQRESRKVQLEYQKQAEKLRQIRDDETKSTSERIAANERLGATLNKQLSEEKRLAQAALNVANLRVQLEGETTAALDAQAAALTEIADIEERITGQQSEQLTNRVQLQREAADRSREITEQKAEVEAEAARIKTEQEKAATEAAVNLARYELNEYIRTNKSKIDADKFFTEASLNEEQKRLDAIAEKRREFAKIELEKGAIDQLEYNARINEINDANQAERDELQAARLEAERQRQAVDMENYFQLIDEQAGREYEALILKLENERKAEIEAAEKTGASIDLIEKKYAQRQKQIEEQTVDAKIDGYGVVFGAYSQILGEQTALGKAAAIAQTTIATYQSAQEAYKALAGIFGVGPALGTAAAIAATVAGLQRVGKIAGIQFAEGGVLKGPSHQRGGIPFSVGGIPGFEAEGGEAIINKRSTEIYRPLLSAINQAGGGTRFAGGGIAGATSVNPSSSLIDYTLMASLMAEANKTLPRPVVSVEEINSVNSTVTAVENLSTL